MLKNKTITIIVGLICASLITLLLGFLIFISSVNSKPRLRGNADAIVVLTGGPSRIEEAVRLLAEKRGKRLLISGVHPSTSRRALTKLLPEHKRLFKCCIDIGYLATDTIGNASETRDWVNHRGFDSIIVVTASYHMPRSMLELRRVLPNVRLIPYPVSVQNVRIESWWAYRGTLWLLTKEYFKTLSALSRLGASRVTYYVAE